MAHQVRIDPIATERALVLRLDGVLDPVEDTGAARTLAEATAALPPPAVVVLDLRELELLTANGARMLDAFAHSCRERGIRCRLLVDPADAGAEVLDAVDAEGRLPRFAKLAEALAEQPGSAPTASAGLVASTPDADLDRMLDEFESLTRTLLGAGTVAGALQQVVDAAVHVVPAADLVSVTLQAPDGTFSTPVQTDALAVELDQVQYRTGQGPCLDVADPAGPGYVASDDLYDEKRWPEFTALATGRGFGAIICTGFLPADQPTQVFGALNIFSRRMKGLSSTDRYAALLLATHVSLALNQVHTVELAELHDAQLSKAIDSRDVIGQAKGILMNRQGITPDEAFTILSSTSQDLNIKLVDLARTLAAHPTDLDLPKGPSASDGPL